MVKDDWTKATSVKEAADQAREIVSEGLLGIMDTCYTEVGERYLEIFRRFLELYDVVCEENGAS